MSTSVDTRVVEMQFDNASFQKGVAETMSSLDKLSNKLDHPAGFKGLSALSEGISSINFTPITSGLDFLHDKVASVFTGLQNMASGVTKAAEIAAAGLIATATGVAITGGIRRAENIEQAKFQLEGLGVAWKDIAGDIDYAVKGTAYGLDSAAKASAQLSASGVQIGDSMKTALRAISGVAAMTNSDYDSIAAIFTTVAGQGKLMTMQLRQLESRGLNAAAKLGEKLGYTEAEIRELVTEGKIGFEEFAWAMDDAFGEHAKDANKTFSGAMSNVKAALSRIGADFATFGMEQLREVFVELIPLIDQFRKVTQPIAGLLDDVLGTGAKQFAGFLHSITESDVITDFAKNFKRTIYDLTHYIDEDLGESYDLSHPIIIFATGLSTALSHVQTVLSQIGGSFKEVFGDSIKLPNVVDLTNMANEFLSFVNSMKPSEETLARIGEVATGVFTVLQKGIAIVMSLGNAIGTALAPVIDIIGNALMFAANAAGDFFIWLADAIGPIDTTTASIEGIGDAIGSFLSKIAAHMPTWQGFRDAAKDVLSFFSEMNLFKDLDIDPFKNGEEKAQNFFVTISGILSGLGQVFHTAFNSIASFVKDTFGSIFDFIMTGLKSMSIGDILAMGLFPSLIGFIGSLSTAFLELAQRIKYFSLTSLTGLSGPLTALTNQLHAMTATMRIKAVLGIAVAIGILALSLKQLSEIDPAGLINAVLAIGALTAILTSAFLALANFADNPKAFKSIAKIGGTMVAMAVGVAVLAAAVRALATLDPTALWTAIGAVTVLTVVLTTAASLLGNLAPRMVRSGIGLIFMAKAILTLSIALKVLSTIPLDSMKTALIGLGVALAIMTVAMIAMTRLSKQLPSFALAITAMADALLVLSIALKLLSTIPMDQMGTALIGLGGALAAITASMILMSRFSKNLPSFALGMLSMGVSILALSAAMKVLSTIPLEQMGIALLGLAGGMAVMSIAMIAMSKLGDLTGAAGLLVISIALMAIAPALKLLSTIPLEGVGTGLLMLAGALTILGLASVLIPAPLLAMLAGSLLAISVAVMAVGAGMAMAGAGMLAFAAALVAIASIAPAAANGIIMLIQGVILGILGMIGNIATAVVEGITVFLETLVANIGRIAEAGRVLVTTLLTVIGETIPQLVALGLQMLLALLQGLASNAQAIVGAALQLLANFIYAIASGIGQVIDAGAKLAIGFISGVGDALRNNAGLLGDAVTNVIATIFGLVEGLIADGLEAIFGPNPVADWIRQNAEGEIAEAEAASQRVAEALGSNNDKAVDDNKSMMAELTSSTEEGGADWIAAASGVSNDALSALTGNLGNAPEDMSQFIGMGIDEIAALSGDAEAAGTQVGESEVQGSTSAISDESGAVVGEVENTVSEMGSVDSYSAGYGSGSNFGSGEYAGLDAWHGSIVTKAAQMVKDAKKAADDAMNAKSPARDLIESGGYFALGFMIGIMDNTFRVAEAAERMVAEAKEPVSNIAVEMSSMMDSIDWDVNPTITPVLDTSLLEEGMAGVDSLMSRTYSYPMSIRAFDTVGYSPASNRVMNLSVELNYNAGTDAAEMVNGIVDGLQTALNLEG